VTANATLIDNRFYLRREINTGAMGKKCERAGGDNND
jgi:hypothetical protein